ncbi:MAG TPA: hypothetical protein VLJ39_09110 [Tepidisphaeraceae bacterium]|nr:hypothetical protein [Tepidisphaeraceae bacterium]
MRLKSKAPFKTKPLPKGLKAAKPNKKQLKQLKGDNFTTNGGTHSVMHGQPLVGGNSVANN